jgi:hypothetical protein
VPDDVVAVDLAGPFGGRPFTDPVDIRTNVLADTPVCAAEESWRWQNEIATAQLVSTAWLSGELRPLPGYSSG